MIGRSATLLECWDNNLRNQHCFGGEGVFEPDGWLEIRIMKKWPKCSKDFWQALQVAIRPANNNVPKTGLTHDRNGSGFQ